MAECIRVRPIHDLGARPDLPLNPAGQEQSMSRTTERREPLEGLRRHKLLPKEIRAALPPLNSTDGASFDDRLLVAKFFCPYNGWRWYAVEFDGSDIFFGYVEGFEKEWGYFSFRELSETSIKGGVPAIERDLYFRPTRFRHLNN